MVSAGQCQRDRREELRVTASPRRRTPEGYQCDEDDGDVLTMHAEERPNGRTTRKNILFCENVPPTEVSCSESLPYFIYPSDSAQVQANFETTAC